MFAGEVPLLEERRLLGVGLLDGSIAVARGLEQFPLDLEHLPRFAADQAFQSHVQSGDAGAGDA